MSLGGPKTSKNQKNPKNRGRGAFDIEIPKKPRKTPKSTRETHFFILTQPLGKKLDFYIKRPSFPKINKKTPQNPESQTLDFWGWRLFDKTPNFQKFRSFDQILENQRNFQKSTKFQKFPKIPDF
jgi:hypothetical protein